MAEKSSNPKSTVLIFDFGQTLARNLNSFTSKSKVFAEAELVQNKLLEVLQHKTKERDDSHIITGLAQSLLKVTPTVTAKRISDMILEFKKQKRAKIVTQNIPMYRMIISGLQKEGCLPEQLEGEDLEGIESVVKEVLKREDIFVVDWEMFPDTLSTLKALREGGHELSVISNSSNKVMQLMMMREFGIGEYIDVEAQFVIDEGARKPDPVVLEPVIEMFGKEKDYWIIGDMLDRDVLCGLRGNINTIFFAQEPMHDEGNVREFKNIVPHYSIFCLKQIPPIVKYHNVPKRVVVGYYMDAKKLKRQIKEDDILVDTSEIQFRYIDARVDIAHQGHIDVFVHKLNEYYAKEEEGNDYERYLSQIRNFAAENDREVLVIDQPDNLKSTIYRHAMGSRLKESIKHFEEQHRPAALKIRFPTSASKESHVSLSVFAGMIKDHFQFPAFVKTNIACIQENSHLMAVINSIDALEDAIENTEGFQETELFIQELIPDDGFVYKVYMLGDRVEGYKRKISANIDNEKSWYIFNSQDQQKGAKTATDNEITSSDVDLYELELFMQTLKKTFGLSFFGVDLIKSRAESNTFYIIDINYFPGYREIKNLAEKMNDFLLREYQRWSA